MLLFCFGIFLELWKTNKLPNLGTAGRSVGDSGGMRLGTACLGYFNLEREDFPWIIKRFNTLLHFGLPVDNLHDCEPDFCWVSKPSIP